MIDIIKKCLNEPKTVDAVLYNRIIETHIRILKEQADDNSLSVGHVSFVSAQNAKTTNYDLVRVNLISSLISSALCSKDNVSISASQALTSLILHFPPYMSYLLCSIFIPSLPAALATQPED
ncbi:MAG: hypothetical protein EZS28_004461 [Streblomastix strix]|uniref:Uncharacterized protein n=1 Tax=Streblomastix strix TaxID=222440 RepID=A0A5J4WY48_9EUKA|nr:MAG: hypothetical protein EZS28_004461 [Streblomastix strix]